MSGQKIRNMEEFAAKSGVSRPTVSKYFNDPTSVRKSTRERIEEALERYNFRPNLYAVNQNRRLTKNIGIVVPYVADPFFAEIARTIERRCIDAGFSPSTFSSHGSVEHEIEILETLRSMRPAGVLLAPLGRASDRKKVEAFCHDVPTVLVDSNIEGLGAAFIGLDNFQSVPLMVEYLCRTGEPPCFFEMPPVNPNANKRRSAYIQSMERLGHTPHVIRVEGQGWDFEDIGYSGGLRVLDNGELSSRTVLCSNDRLAIGFMAAAYERGIRVGITDECTLRIAGHDDHPFSRFTCPSLTTISQDYDAISTGSVETLMNFIEDGVPSGPRSDTLFDGHLVMRSSA
ncbi:LacI family DNA-binding transcriptional regulator [Roseobacter sp. N2S]|uniref:LacI family DNA-binding transcriptional regulator n=1 Tax=Roseobacter sp. N2S TaxID=2663844 RepID=UPI0028548204|nr:LacI family DNA-binding transcriptional regulator [Roseobacter sp. N2S]MDR6265646.1 DNA-binding LacI/PurR family transcriptional regulator [Roseobacter sp. N2S]